MIAQWKNRFLQIASRIGASWLLAIGILLGAQAVTTMVAMAHPDGGAIMPAASCGKILILHDIGDNTVIYTNAAFIVNVNQGTMNGKPATLVGLGNQVLAVRESPEDVAAQMRGQN